MTGSNRRIPEVNGWLRRWQAQRQGIQKGASLREQAELERPMGDPGK